MRLQSSNSTGDPMQHTSNNTEISAANTHMQFPIDQWQQQSIVLTAVAAATGAHSCRMIFGLREL